MRATNTTFRIYPRTTVYYPHYPYTTPTRTLRGRPDTIPLPLAPVNTGLIGEHRESPSTFERSVRRVRDVVRVSYTKPNL